MCFILSVYSTTLCAERTTKEAIVEYFSQNTLMKILYASILSLMILKVQKTPYLDTFHAVSAT